MTCVKNGKVVSIKSLVRDDIHKRDLLEMIERFENPNEMALALSAGFGFIVKGWVKQGKTLSGVNYTVDTNLSNEHNKLCISALTNKLRKRNSAFVVVLNFTVIVASSAMNTANAVINVCLFRYFV